MDNYKDGLTKDARQLEQSASLSTQRTIGEKVLHLADRLREAFTTAARSRGLTFAEGRALRHLSCRSGEPRLTDLLDCTPARVTRILNKLERLGYVERTPSPIDRRAKIIRVTRRGDEAIGQILDVLYDLSPLMTALTEPERDQFEQLLDRMAGT